MDAIQTVEHKIRVEGIEQDLHKSGKLPLKEALVLTESIDLGYKRRLNRILTFQQKVSAQKISNGEAPVAFNHANLRQLKNLIVDQIGFLSAIEQYVNVHSEHPKTDLVCYAHLITTPEVSYSPTTPTVQVPPNTTTVDGVPMAPPPPPPPPPPLMTPTAPPPPPPRASPGASQSPLMHIKPRKAKWGVECEEFLNPQKVNEYIALLLRQVQKSADHFKGLSDIKVTAESYLENLQDQIKELERRILLKVQLGLFFSTSAAQNVVKIVEKPEYAETLQHHTKALLKKEFIRYKTLKKFFEENITPLIHQASSLGFVEAVVRFPTEIDFATALEMLKLVKVHPNAFKRNLKNYLGQQSTQLENQKIKLENLKTQLIHFRIILENHIKPILGANYQTFLKSYDAQSGFKMISEEQRSKIWQTYKAFFKKYLAKKSKIKNTEPEEDKLWEAILVRLKKQLSETRYGGFLKSDNTEEFLTKEEINLFIENQEKYFNEFFVQLKPTIKKEEMIISGVESVKGQSYTSSVSAVRIGRNLEELLLEKQKHLVQIEQSIEHFERFEKILKLIKDNLGASQYQAFLTSEFPIAVLSQEVMLTVLEMDTKEIKERKEISEQTGLQEYENSLKENAQFFNERLLDIKHTILPCLAEQTLRLSPENMNRLEQAGKLWMKYTSKAQKVFSPESVEIAEKQVDTAILDLAKRAQVYHQLIQDAQEIGADVTEIRRLQSNSYKKLVYYRECVSLGSGLIYRAQVSQYNESVANMIRIKEMLAAYVGRVGEFFEKIKKIGGVDVAKITEKQSPEDLLEKNREKYFTSLGEKQDDSEKGKKPSQVFLKSLSDGKNYYRSLKEILTMEEYQRFVCWEIEDEVLPKNLITGQLQADNFSGRFNALEFVSPEAIKLFVNKLKGSSKLLEEVEKPIFGIENGPKKGLVQISQGKLVLREPLVASQFHFESIKREGIKIEYFIHRLIQFTNQSHSGKPGFLTCIKVLELKECLKVLQIASKSEDKALQEYRTYCSEHNVPNKWFPPGSSAPVLNKVVSESEITELVFSYLKASYAIFKQGIGSMLSLSEQDPGYYLKVSPFAKLKLPLNFVDKNTETAQLELRAIPLEVSAYRKLYGRQRRPQKGSIAHPVKMKGNSPIKQTKNIPNGLVRSQPIHMNLGNELDTVTEEPTELRMAEPMVSIKVTIPAFELHCQDYLRAYQAKQKVLEQCLEKLTLFLVPNKTQFEKQITEFIKEIEEERVHVLEKQMNQGQQTIHDTYETLIKEMIQKRKVLFEKIDPMIKQVEELYFKAGVEEATKAERLKWCQAECGSVKEMIHREIQQLNREKDKLTAWAQIESVLETEQERQQRKTLIDEIEILLAELAGFSIQLQAYSDDAETLDWEKTKRAVDTQKTQLQQRSRDISQKTENLAAQFRTKLASNQGQALSEEQKKYLALGQAIQDPTKRSAAIELEIAKLKMATQVQNEAAIETCLANENFTEALNIYKRAGLGKEVAANRLRAHPKRAKALQAFKGFNWS